MHHGCSVAGVGEEADGKEGQAHGSGTRRVCLRPCPWALTAIASQASLTDTDIRVQKHQDTKANPHPRSSKPERSLSPTGVLSHHRRLLRPKPLSVRIQHTRLNPIARRARLVISIRKPLQPRKHLVVHQLLVAVLVEQGPRGDAPVREVKQPRLVVSGAPEDELVAVGRVLSGAEER